MDEPDDMELSEHVRRLDASVASFVECIEVLKEQQKNFGNANTQTVVHQQAGMGAWSIAAVVACFFTFLGLILFAMVVIPELHDLKAWSDIYRSKIYTLEKHP